MTMAVETPSAVIDRVSLVLDAFDGPGRLNLAQIVRRTGLPRSSAHRMLERLVHCAGCAATDAITSWGCGWSNSAHWPCTRTGYTARRCPCCMICTARRGWWYIWQSSTAPTWSTWRRSATG